MDTVHANLPQHEAILLLLPCELGPPKCELDACEHMTILFRMNTGQKFHSQYIFKGRYFYMPNTACIQRAVVKSEI